ncbi:hypothetical protein PNEG_00437 [Pneumocystis murina B123]|uniref:Ribonucleases P/MRP subunit Pop8-like domain-containing protein n=1 Tax=Pneumocystis murina (strain B123) TaxID=1069680 RepID=M7PLS6_PNEMU|nr:hypothetical protein PNEG_00437 [Pneumocystis murina B123]EMR11414.1 hypothetical protein PNEG_00437 [Pneumocystis murina B123]
MRPIRMRIFSDFVYFHMKLNESYDDKEIDRKKWQIMIKQALSQGFGLEGESIMIDILHLTKDKCVYIRVPSREESRFWVAMTGYCEKNIQILGVSDHLMGLINRSRLEKNLHEKKNN